MMQINMQVQHDNISINDLGIYMCVIAWNVKGEWSGSGLKRIQASNETRNRKKQ